jgi:hypothetical protein
MATCWMILSGFLGAMSNLCMRHSVADGKTAPSFFIFQLFFTCLVTILLYPIRTECYTCNLPIIVFGIAAGLFLGSMKWMLGKALQTGPAGLTFAAVNAAAVIPAIVITLTAGSVLNLQLNQVDYAGYLLVLLGLFWAGWDRSSQAGSLEWIAFAFFAFSAHLFFLLVTQYRTLIAGNYFATLDSRWMPSPENMASDWFVPIVFAAACLMHTLIYSYSEKKLPSPKEAAWGTLAGLLNGLCAFLYIYALEIASLHETTYIFAVFSIALIIFCNLWGQRIYRENINWKANAICLAGIWIVSLR